MQGRQAAAEQLGEHLITPENFEIAWQQAFGELHSSDPSVGGDSFRIAELAFLEENNPLLADVVKTIHEKVIKGAGENYGPENAPFAMFGALFAHRVLRYSLSENEYKHDLCLESRELTKRLERQNGALFLKRFPEGSSMHSLMEENFKNESARASAKLIFALYDNLFLEGNIDEATEEPSTDNTSPARSQGRQVNAIAVLASTVRRGGMPAAGWWQNTP